MNDARVKQAVVEGSAGGIEGDGDQTEASQRRSHRGHRGAPRRPQVSRGPAARIDDSQAHDHLPRCLTRGSAEVAREEQAEEGQLPRYPGPAHGERETVHSGGAAREVADESAEHAQEPGVHRRRLDPLADPGRALQRAELRWRGGQRDAGVRVVVPGRDGLLVEGEGAGEQVDLCLLYTSPSPRDED